MLKIRSGSDPKILFDAATFLILAYTFLFSSCMYMGTLKIRSGSEILF